jgi:hypothetical protein
VEWVVAGFALAAVGAVGAVLGRREVGRRAAVALAHGLRDAERRVTDAVGGTARIELDGEPLQVLLRLRDGHIPSGRLVVERARLPNGLDVRYVELTARGEAEVADLVARITPRAVSRQLGVTGLAVRVSRGRLRLLVGLASVGVDVTVVDGRVVLKVPVAPPPIGTVLSAGLTELVPRPPPSIELHDVSVVDDELEVRAIVDLRGVVDELDLD